LFIGLSWSHALGALGLTVLGAALALRARRSWVRLGVSTRTRLALRAERDAERLLVEHGYRIEARQPRTRWELFVDGEPVGFDLRADLLLTRGGRRWIAEVKTGAHAPDLATPATRRQLVEYALAYDVDGVLLVDMEHGAVREVALGRRRPRGATAVAWLVFAVVSALVLALAAWLATGRG